MESGVDVGEMHNSQCSGAGARASLMDGWIACDMPVESGMQCDDARPVRTARSSRL